MGMKIGGQDPGNIFEQAAARDVRQCMDAVRANFGEQRFHINARRRHQRIDQQRVGIEQRRAVQFPALVRREPPDQ